MAVGNKKDKKVVARAKPKAAARAVVVGALLQVHEASEAKAPRRRLDRRDSDERVDRVLDRRLTLQERAHAETLVLDNLTIRDHIKTVYKSKGKRARFSNEDWKTIYTNFGLATSTASLLPQPPSDLPIRDELADAIGMLHSDNPATRNSDALVALLRHCSPLNERELFGLLGGTVEGPTLTASCAEKVQGEVLRYISRWLKLRDLYYHFKIFTEFDICM